MKKNLLTVTIIVLVLIAGNANADFGWADSAPFDLNLLFLHSTSFQDSETFYLNLTNVFRGWADSDVFPYMWAYASTPPDPTVLQITGIGILRLVDASHPLDISKPTIVLTHGWNPGFPGYKTNPGQVPGWITMMKESIFAQSWSQNWNVLWWDWLEKATALSPAGPAKQTQWQGNYLGNALMDSLGDNYSQYIHFIGFSLGTSVNKWAADMVHNNGWDSAKTHVTVLDSAEIGDLADYVKPIPNQAVYVDCFLTAFGDLHDGARNVILTKGAPILPTSILDYIDFHAYSNQWYDMTIDNPSSSIMGMIWSFENGGFLGAPAAKSCYAQTTDPFDNQMNLDEISWTDAQVRIAGRTVLQVAQGVGVVYGMATTPLKLLGDVALDTTKQEVTAKLKEVVFGGAASYAMNNLALDTENQTTSSYLWIPLTIPAGVDLMSFDYKFMNCSAGDYVTISISDRQVFIMEAKFAPDDQYASSSYIDISGLSGKNVEILVAFNCDDIPGGELDVTNFAFHSTAVPVDLNKDGLVNFKDFASVSRYWAANDCNEINSWCSRCDFDRNGVVDTKDIAVISNHWLRDAGDPNTW